MCLATELMSSKQKPDKSAQTWWNTVLPYKQTLLQGSLSPSNDGWGGEHQISIFNRLKVVGLNSRFLGRALARACPSGDAVWEEGFNHTAPQCH